MSESQITRPQADPGEASAEDGLVVLDGPDGVAITLTAQAAKITGERLIEASRLAVEQGRERKP